MAIDIFPKAWGVIPPPTARAIRGHPLCPAIGVVFNGAIVDLVSGFVGTPASGSTWVESGSKLFPGKALKRANASATKDIVIPATPLPAQSLTVVCAVVRLSTGVTDSVAAAVDTTFNSGLDCYFVINDPDTTSAFWHVGNATGSGAALLVNNANFRYDEDSIFFFTAGPRGMEIWENGKLAGSNGTNPTRTVTNNNIVCGPFTGAANPDAHKFKFLFYYARQLRPEDIGVLSANPFVWVDPRP